MSTVTHITVRDIADVLGRSIYQVRYAVESRNIEPVHRAGPVRLFDPSAIAAVSDALRAIDARRTAAQEAKS